MTQTSSNAGIIVALSGGVGGAKLVLGLSRVVPADQLIVVANTGDDFEHLGLHISPDTDTLLYTLADIANADTGWGLRGDTWTFMNALEALGGETWFRLGDGDLATHVERTRRLSSGESLSEITSEFCRRLRIDSCILPMSDDRVRTRIRTPERWLDFQDYFVKHQCLPRTVEIAFEGAAAAEPNPHFLSALARSDLRAVVICPSNPFISIEPILALPGVRQALRECSAPIVGVAPIIGGEAVKGPTAKMMGELGLHVSAVEVARRYDGLLDAYIVDPVDAASAADLPLHVVSAPIFMRTLADREQLARVVLATADTLVERFNARR